MDQPSFIVFNLKENSIGLKKGFEHALGFLVIRLKKDRIVTLSFNIYNVLVSVNKCLSFVHNIMILRYNIVFVLAV